MALGPNERPDRVIAVLGMHRSGTSALVGSLQQRGLFLGRHSTRNTYNLRGNRENPDVVQLNEDILEHSGGSWHAPPADGGVGAGPRRARTRHPRRACGAPAMGVQGPAHAADARWLAPARSGPRVRGGVQAPRAGGAIPRRSSGPAGRGPGRGVACLQRAAAGAAPPQRVSRGLLRRRLRRPGPEPGSRLRRCSGWRPPPRTEPFFTDDLRRMEAEPAGLPPDVSALYEELRALAL